MSRKTLHPVAARDGAVRRVERVVRGSATSDGAGVRLTRFIGTPGLPSARRLLGASPGRSATQP